MFLLLRFTFSIFDEDKAFFSDKFTHQGAYLDFTEYHGRRGFVHIDRNDYLGMSFVTNKVKYPLTKNIFSSYGRQTYFTANHDKPIRYNFWRIDNKICDGLTVWAEQTEGIELELKNYAHNSSICIFSPITYTLVSYKSNEKLRVVYNDGSSDAFNPDYINAYSVTTVYPFIIVVPPSENTTLYVKFDGEDAANTNVCNLNIIEDIFSNKAVDYTIENPFTYRCVRRAERKLEQFGYAQIVIAICSSLFFLIRFYRPILGYINPIPSEQPQVHESVDDAVLTENMSKEHSSDDLNNVIIKIDEEL